MGLQNIMATSYLDYAARTTCTALIMLVQHVQIKPQSFCIGHMKNVPIQSCSVPSEEFLYYSIIWACKYMHGHHLIHIPLVNDAHLNV